MGKRETWFDSGAQVLRQVVEAFGLQGRYPSTGDVYLCPCCFTPHPRTSINNRLLTIEHVPPEILGGDELLLTCGKCNHTAGTKFDSQANIQAAVHSLQSGNVPHRAVRATFETGGVQVNGEMSPSNDGTRVNGQGVHVRNRKEKITDYEQALLDSNPITVTVTERFSSHRADVSWVRSAYLAAFAALGICYITLPVLEPIRRQLASPDAEILPQLNIFYSAYPSTTRGMMIVDSPEELRSVLVVIGKCLVFLPDPWNPQSCDELSQAIARLSDSGFAQLTLNGKRIPWPDAPTYLLDKTALILHSQK